MRANRRSPITLQAMSNNKESWRKVLMTANEIQTCVDNTARALHHRGEQTDLPVVVIAALGTSGECAIRFNALYRRLSRLACSVNVQAT